MSENNVYPYDRIAHLENNSYIYGNSIPFPSANFSPIEDSLSKPQESTISYENEIIEPYKSQDSLKIESLNEPYQESVNYEREESPNRYQYERQESPNRYQMIESSIERQISEKEAYWSRRSAEIRETWKQLQLNNAERSHSPPRRPLSNRNSSPSQAKHTRPSSMRNKSKTSAKKIKKYEHMNNQYSKINTKSPYCKSTFSHEVRNMENQPYTYKAVNKKKITKGSGKKNQEEGMLDRIIKVVEKHAKFCPHLKSEVEQIKRENAKKWR